MRRNVIVVVVVSFQELSNVATHPIGLLSVMQSFWVSQVFGFVFRSFMGSNGVQNVEKMKIIRIDLDTAGARLTSPNIENLHFNVLGSFSVLEFTLKTIHVVQGLPITNLVMFSINH